MVGRRNCMCMPLDVRCRTGKRGFIPGDQRAEVPWVGPFGVDLGWEMSFHC